jgi:hypothetical protein
MHSNAAQPPQTVRDLLHSLRNSFNLISGHSQYLLSEPAVRQVCGEELLVIWRASDKAARELALVPDSIVGLALGPITTSVDAAVTRPPDDAMGRSTI